MIRRLGRISPLGFLLALAVIALAALGPFFAPHSPSEIVGVPFQAPDATHWLGTDNLGRDGLSRVLWGGRATVTIALLATMLTYAIGVPLGLLAGFRRDWSDGLLMRGIDVVQAFPPIILVLLIIAGVGRSVPWLVVAVALVFVPGVTRVVRAATIEVSVKPFVEASVARGERTFPLLAHEVLPNISPVLLADVGIRFTGTVLLAASLNYLGLGVAPPASEWGLLIAENRGGLQANPWITIAPAALIACLTVSGNLISDAFRQARDLEHGLEREALA